MRTKITGCFKQRHWDENKQLSPHSAPAGAGMWPLGLMLLAAVLMSACGEPRPPRPAPNPEDSAPQASSLPQEPSPTAVAALPDAVTPGGAATPTGAVDLAVGASDAQALPGATTPAAAQPLDVEVSDLPPSDTQTQVLVGYERPGKSRRREPVDLSTDRNSVEFPQSLTRAKISYVANPAGSGAGPARALELEITLPSQQTQFATCSGKSACGCKGIVPYAYISLSHGLPAGTDLAKWQHLSLWVRSKEAFDLHVMLSCFVEPRPRQTMPPFNGYLDEDLTEMNPCWYAPRAELPLREPIRILGDDRWHRYQVRIDDIPPGEPVTFTGGGQMVCTVQAVTHVIYVLKKNQPPVTGEYPANTGVIRFDDLQAVGPTD